MLPTLVVIALAAVTGAADPKDAVDALEKLHVHLHRGPDDRVTYARLPPEGVTLTEAAPHLARLPRLSWVGCFGNSLSEDGVRALAAVKGLEQFEVNANRRCLPVPLAALKTVTCVRLSGDGIRDDMLQAISVMPAVTNLHLDRVAVTPAGLAHLKKLRGLEMVLIQSSKLTAEGVKRIGEVERLKDLTLCGNAIGADGFTHLGTLTSLRYLNLESTGCTDADVEELKDLVLLTDLDLGYNPAVTDGGIAYLAGLPKLAGLRLYGTFVTDAGVAELKKARPRLVVGK